MFRFWPYVLTLVLFVAYCAWIAGPYLRSIVVRDAAVTSWSNVATAPVDGTVTFAPVALGGRVSEDGLIATVTNNHISRDAVDDAALRVALAAAEREHARTLLAEIESLEDDRRETKSHYARVFRKQLDSRIAALRAEIRRQEERLAVMRGIAGRKAQLVERGAGSANDADEVSLRVAEIELEIQSLEADLDYAGERRAAADVGVFIEEGGDDPGWVRGARLELKLEKKRARLELRAAEMRLEAAEAELANAAADLERRTVGEVRAPPGRLLWGRRAATGMAVSAGAPIAEWIDCGDLLVDMPVSDAEASLIFPGDTADVILEGEKTARTAEVLLVRGAASTLGRDELVALAKGRRAGLAQALLRLDAAVEEFSTCPVGRAAHVDFPGVGLIAVVRARLRL